MEDSDWAATEETDSDGVGWNVGSTDPHDVVYTSVYDTGVYFARMMVAYAAADSGGSGIDTRWATSWCRSRKCGVPELSGRCDATAQR